jgi:hypothetical protein
MVSAESFLARLLPDQPVASDDEPTLTELAKAALAKSKSQLIDPIAMAFNELSDDEKQDFLERILILDGSPRIDDIPATITGQTHAKHPARTPRVRLRAAGRLVDRRHHQAVDWYQHGRNLRLRSLGQAVQHR